MVTSAVERCAIHLAELDPTRGREIAKTPPVVIVSQEDMNRYPGPERTSANGV